MLKNPVLAAGASEVVLCILNPPSIYYAPPTQIMRMTILILF
jgi:hypothetical protein